MILASIPSPSEGVWHLAGFPIRGYALCIIVGIVAAIIVGDKRLIARGGEPNQIADIAMWVVPIGDKRTEAAAPATAKDGKA